MKKSFSSDPSAHKPNHKVRNAARAAVAVSALALAGCSVAPSADKAQSARTPAHAAAPAKPNKNVGVKSNAEVAFEQAKESQVEQVKLAALAAANRIVDGLGLPGVGAENYESGDPYTFGNAQNAGGTKLPETFARYSPDSNSISISSLSTIDAPGNSTSIDLVFRLTDPSPITSQGSLTLDSLRSAFSDPANLQLVGADVSPTTIDQGVMLDVYGSDLTAMTGGVFGSAVGPLSNPGSPGYFVEGTPVTNTAQLSEVTFSLNEQLEAVSNQLLEQFNRA